MPNFSIVERDYTQIYDKFVTVGPKLEKGKIGAHGVSYSVSEEYEELKSIVELGMMIILFQLKMIDRE